MHAMLDEETLTSQLEEMGWQLERHGEGTYRSVRHTSQGEVVVYVRLTDDWLFASVVPFLSTRGDNSFELSRWLLRMNRDMYQGKFAYDEDGDVVLSVDLPTESLDITELRAALDNLVEYTVQHRTTLRQASQHNEDSK